MEVSRPLFVSGKAKRAKLSPGVRPVVLFPETEPMKQSTADRCIIITGGTRKISWDAGSYR